MGLVVFKRDDELDKLFVFFPGGDVGVPQCKECVAPAMPRGRTPRARRSRPPPAATAPRHPRAGSSRGCTRRR